MFVVDTNSRQPSGVRDESSGGLGLCKNTLARLCAKNAGGAYLLDTTVYVYTPVLHLGPYCVKQSLAALRGRCPLI